MSDIQVYKQQAQMVSYDEIEKLAKAMVASGYFQDVKSVAQAIVKIKAGQEFGFGAFASMNGIYIINGRPAAGANLMASAIKSSGRYDYRVIQLDDKICELAFYENGKDIGHSIFTIEDARKAGTKNLDKFPRNMLFARAMSNGVRWYCPDVLNGNVIYTPEELGAEVDQDGNVLIIQDDQTPVEIEEVPKIAQAADINSEEQVKISDEESDKSDKYINLPILKRPLEPEQLQEKLKSDAKKCYPASEAQYKLLTRKMQELIKDEHVRHSVNEFLFGAEHISAAKPEIVVAGINWMNLDDQYRIDPTSESELASVINRVTGVDLIEPFNFGEQQNSLDQSQGDSTVDFITLEEACLIKNSQGVPYGELSPEQLSRMSIGISKALKKPDLTAEEKAEYQKKFKAIGILLKAKSEGVIN